MKLSRAVVVSRKKWLDFGTTGPNYPQESQQYKKWGLEEVCSLLSVYNVLHLAASFHSDNLAEMD